MKMPKPLSSRKKQQLINIAWEQLEGFIKDWQASPYEYGNERDIQVEITSRIKRKYKARGLHKIRAVYKHDVVKGYEKGQRSRVCCEPKTYYRDNKKASGWSHPDIVVWDNLKDPKHPPDVDKEGHKTGKNCPMLWLCEIKYYPGWGKRPDEYDNWDLDKIKFLRRRNETRYACWLNITRMRAKSGNGIKKSVENKTLIKYNIKLPAI